jgi:hypothetical protein
VLIALLAVGCGADSGDEDAAAGDGGGEATEARPGPAIELTITFWPEGPDGESVEATLTCDPAGGTHPDPESACAALAADSAALEPVPPDVDDEQVDAAFERSNGCELDRWDRFAAVLQIGD